MHSYDFVVIGAGIAGSSIAAELAAMGRVLLLEAETQPGYHTTGRSAALFTCAYGPAPVRALTRASEAFLRNPNDTTSAQTLLKTRQLMFVARVDQSESLAAMHTELRSAVVPVNGGDIRTLFPLLREGYAATALLDRTASDIDVNALHQHYLKQLNARGGELLTDAKVNALVRQGNNWLVCSKQGKFSTGTVVNAAGAWCDEIAQLADVMPIGLVPKRRSVLIVSAPGDNDFGTCPMVVDVEEKFLLKPEAGKLLISPADETPSPPCDAQPEELDCAICVDRIETAFDMKVTRIERKWAGLRNFVADRCPVVGFSEDHPGFFWLAGQGGYGIQTSPALSRLAAAIALNEQVPKDILDQGLELEALNPARRSLFA